MKSIKNKTIAKKYKLYQKKGIIQLVGNPSKKIQSMEFIKLRSPLKNEHKSSRETFLKKEF